MTKFIGRKTELKRLTEATHKQIASLIIIKGRRRIGKSRLIEEFSKNFNNVHTFTGLAPSPSSSIAKQLQEFSRQISLNFNSPPAQYNNWGDTFWALSQHLKPGKTLLIFDEISWMGSKDKQFLSHIKNLWDLYLKKNNRLIFIICGSASAWIEKNIMSNTGFVGRISFRITLRELPLNDCSKFWPKNISTYEKLKWISVSGGIPRYLEEMNPNHSAEENIKRTCFTEGGLLVEEYQQIFSDIMLRESASYRKILLNLASGAKTLQDLQTSLKADSQGRILEYLNELILSGFISRDYTWNLRTGEDSKLSQFRLQDNYLRFYLKYIEKNLPKINRGIFQQKSLSTIPGWHSIMGLQFENLVLSNNHKLQEILNINPDDLINANPYFQRQTQRQKGCQIDYLIQTRFDTLYLCEIKFSKHPIGKTVIDAIQAKINAINPKHFSCRPVLVHANGITKDLADSDYFANIIDIKQFFE